jgi:flagellar FliL protein
VNRKSVVAISSLLALLSGGAATWIAVTGHGLAYYFGSESEEAEAPLEKEASIFVKMDPMQLVVRSQSGRNYQVLLTLNLELVEPKDKAKVEKMAPRLRDAYVRELFGVPMAAEGQWRANELESVKQRLLAQSNRVLGGEMIASVLIQQVIPLGR